jgi:ACT domain-containing protein
MVRNYIRTTTDKWDKRTLTKVLDKIRTKSLTIDNAVKRYPISRATIYRHLKDVKEEENREEQVILN